MLPSPTTGFLQRLRSGEEAAWFELWQTFGPVVRTQLAKWGRGRISPETVQDLSQETLAALSGSIDRFDPSRGARFSTWLLAIAKHVLGDAMDKKSAQKRGGGKAASELDESWMVASAAPAADEAYERAVFGAKVEAAIRAVEADCDFLDFSIYRMRVLDGLSGKDVAAQVGVSEPTVSRRLARVRDLLRSRLLEVVTKFSFTAEEAGELGRNGLDPSPNTTGVSVADKSADAHFDEAVGEIYHRHLALRAADERWLSGSWPG